MSRVPGRRAEIELGKVIRLSDRWASMTVERIGKVALTDGVLEHIREHIDSPSEEVIFEHAAAAATFTTFVLERGHNTSRPDLQMFVFDLLEMRRLHGKSVLIDNQGRNKTRFRDLGAVIVHHARARSFDPPECVSPEGLRGVWTIYSLSNTGRRRAMDALAEGTHVVWPEKKAEQRVLWKRLDDRRNSRPS